MKRQRHYNIPQDEIKSLYEGGMSQKQLANHYGCSATVIENRMKEFSIKARSYSKASSNMNNMRIKILSEDQNQLILGSLLGDACLKEANYTSNKKSKSKLTTYRLLFAHSIKQIEYIKHKKELLGGSKIGTRISGYGATIKHFAFCCKPTLQQYADICLKNGKKKVTKEWANSISELGLSYWFMDDGYTIKNKNNITAYLCTDSFDLDEISILRDMLDSFNLETKISKVPSGNRIRFPGTKNSRDFLNLIKQHAIKSMYYKWRDVSLVQDNLQ